MRNKEKIRENITKSIEIPIVIGARVMCNKMEIYDNNINTFNEVEMRAIRKLHRESKKKNWMV